MFKRVVMALVASCLSLAAACPFKDLVGPSGEDHARAALGKPREAYLASGAAAIRAKLNIHLTNGPLAFAKRKPCEEFTLTELDELSAQIMCLRDDSLTVNITDGRKPRHLDVASLAREISSEAAYVAAHPETIPALRDGKCHEIAMAWTHHLTSAGRKQFSESSSIIMPLLPSKGYEEHAPKLIEAGHKKVATKLKAAVTCQIGHQASIAKEAAWEGFPHWPYEVTYNASGYGPYPFWTLGGGTGGKLSGPGTPITTWWSALQNAERLDHASCDMKGVGYENEVPCTHLFLNGSYAYLFSQDQKFCCMSSAPAPGDKCHLTRPQRTFMDVMSLKGTIDNYKSEDGLYTGKAKHYSMHLTNPSDFWFWYITGECVLCVLGSLMWYSTSGTQALSTASPSPSVFTTSP
jgi:hypothetical protein